MIAYRIALTKYCDISGEGAKRYGGRWNFKDFPTIYAGSSVSASLLERLTIDPELFASERYVIYSVMEFHLRDNLVKTIESTELPQDWNTVPPPLSTQEFGTKLLQSGLLCFRVPSVVDPSSYNFVINPDSPDFQSVRSIVYPLKLDQRIVR